MKLLDSLRLEKLHGLYYSVQPFPQFQQWYNILIISIDITVN